MFFNSAPYMQNKNSSKFQAFSAKTITQKALPAINSR